MIGFSVAVWVRGRTRSAVTVPCTDMATNKRKIFYFSFLFKGEITTCSKSILGLDFLGVGEWLTTHSIKKSWVGGCQGGERPIGRYYLDLYF